MLIPTSKPLLGNSIRDCNILPAEIKQFSCSQLLWVEELTWLGELLWPQRPENVCPAQTHLFNIAAKCRVLSLGSVQEGRRSRAVWNPAMIKPGFKSHTNIVTFGKQPSEQANTSEQTGSSLLHPVGLWEMGVMVSVLEISFSYVTFQGKSQREWEWSAPFLIFLIRELLLWVLGRRCIPSSEEDNCSTCSLRHSECSHSPGVWVFLCRSSDSPGYSRHLCWLLPKSELVWWRSLERSFSDPHFVSHSTPVCSLKPKLQTSQSSCLIMNGIIHGAHVLSYVSDIPNVPSSPSSSHRLWLLLAPALLSVWFYLQHSPLLLPISVKYLWIFMLRVFLAEVYQTRLLKVKTLGDGKCGEERLVPRARDREQVYCLGFFLWGDQETTAPPEHRVSS